MQRFRIGMLVLHPGSRRDREALGQLAAALGPSADVGGPDEVGVFEVAVDADDRDDSLRRVWDAVAASGTDDHIVFLEHPELPEHWRRHSQRPR